MEIKKLTRLSIGRLFRCSILCLNSTKSTNYYFGKYLKTGDYKCIWRLIMTATLSKVAMSRGNITVVLAIWRSGNNQAYYWHQVLFNEWTKPVTYIKDNFIINEGWVNRMYFRIKNKQTAFPLYIELMTMDKIKNFLTEATTQDPWLMIDGWCDDISVTNSGKLVEKVEVIWFSEDMVTPIVGAQRHSI